MATQLRERHPLDRLKHKDKAPKRVYPCAVTVCIAARCSEGDKGLIILCSDQKLSYEGVGSAEIGFKLELGGGGWAALIAGPVSNASRLASFYREHLNSVRLTEKNYRTELTVPLSKYREWIVDQFIRRTYFTTLERVLHARPPSPLATDRERILKEAQAERFEEQLILTGYLEQTPILLKVSYEGLEEDAHFICIGSGSWLAHAALLHREYTSATEIFEALYYVYEAKKFSEKDNCVGENTVLFVQEPPVNPSDPALTLRVVSPFGLLHLEGQYYLLGLQPYQQIPYKQSERFYK